MLNLNYFFLFLIFFICSELNARTLITFYPESINFKGYNLVLNEDKKDALEVFEKNRHWKDNPQYKNTKFSNCHNTKDSLFKLHYSMKRETLGKFKKH